MNELLLCKKKIEELNNVINDLLNSEINSDFMSRESDNCPIEELNSLSNAVKNLLTKYSEGKLFLNSLAKGNLSVLPPTKNVFISPFKELHSILKHLIWQINSITGGDLSQTVNFLGDFSDAINSLLNSLKEKHELKEWLEISELKYRNLFSQMTDAFALHEVIFENGIPTDYKFIEVNNAFFKMTGLAESNIVGKNVTEVIPNISKQWINKYAEIAINGLSEQFSQYSPELDKYFLVTAFSTSYGQFATIFSDVTKIKKYEDEIEEARLMLQTVLDHIPQGVFWKDPYLNYLGCNKTAANHAGLKKPSEIIGKSDYDLSWNILADSYRADDLNILSSLKPKINFIEQIRNEEEEIKWIRTNKIPLISHNEKIIGILGTYEDITFQKDAEERIKKINEELKDTIATKDKFFSIIAHDLKSPFQGLLGYSQILFEEYYYLTDEERHFFAKGMFDISKQTFDLLENLLNWSRIQTGKMAFNPELLNLKNILSSTIELLSATSANKSIKLTNRLELTSFINVDRNMLITIVRNLISNSIKFTNPGGEIVIESYQKGKKIFITISDNGIGMDEMTLNNLFKLDKSISTKGTQNEEGSGLGLLLCKEMVEMNEGIITVESQKNVGSKFSLIFEK